MQSCITIELGDNVDYRAERHPVMDGRVASPTQAATNRVMALSPVGQTDWKTAKKPNGNGRDRNTCRDVGYDTLRNSLNRGKEREQPCINIRREEMPRIARDMTAAAGLGPQATRVK